ncbi:MAG: hypothetical protein ACYCZY_04775 [Lacisediminihabitans sp.]
MNELRAQKGKSTLQIGDLTPELRTAIEVVTFSFVMIFFHQERTAQTMPSVAVP